ncbi:MAG TPA: sigma-70 family RNA polymerase sigma factor [Flavobacteriaceae bacterium]|nr:sigma-70 family RNA polymerase sigma factor [Flavobacteriaceae bacterium]
MNQKEFTELVMPFKDKLFRLAKRFLISKDSAEDATQDIYLKLWKNKEKLKTYNNVEAFAMTMVKNHCLDVLKLKSSSNLKIIHNNYKDNSQNLDRETDVKDSVSIVHKLIDDLPTKQKLIIQLRDVEQYSFEEIGKILEIKPTAVRVALSRARKTIREKLLKKHKYGIS